MNPEASTYKKPTTLAEQSGDYIDETAIDVRYWPDVPVLKLSLSSSYRLGLRQTLKAETRYSRLFRASRRLAYKALQKVMTLDITDLMVLGAPVAKANQTAAVEVDYRFLDARAFDEFTVKPVTGADMASRLNSGLDVCFAAIHKDELAAFAWFAFGSIESEHNRGSTPTTGVGLSFPRDTAFMYNTFVDPRFRGNRLYSALVARAAAELSTSSIGRILSTCDWTNRAALRSCYRMGFRRLGRIFRFGWGQRMFTIAPQAARRMDIYIGRHAAVQRREGLPSGKATLFQI